MEPKFFWLKSDYKTVQEISWDEWRNIVKKQWGKSNNTKMLVKVSDSEVYLIKGNRSFWVPMAQLKQVLRQSEKGEG